MSAALSRELRPKTLDRVIGQPKPTAVLRRFVADPYSACWLLEGPPGTGKTTSALAVAKSLGCEDEMSGLRVVCCSELGVDTARDLMGWIRMRPMGGGRWNVLVLEELERLSPQCQTFLKVALEQELPACGVVIATSNGTAGLSDAVRQRFVWLGYGGGECFAEQGQAMLRELWSERTSADLPDDWQQWGWSGKVFSLRVAIDRLQVALLGLESTGETGSEPSESTTSAGVGQLREWVRSRPDVTLREAMAEVRQIRQRLTTEAKAANKLRRRAWELYSKPGCHSFWRVGFRNAKWSRAYETGDWRDVPNYHELVELVRLEFTEIETAADPHAELLRRLAADVVAAPTMDDAAERYMEQHESAMAGAA